MPSPDRRAGTEPAMPQGPSTAAGGTAVLSHAQACARLGAARTETVRDDFRALADGARMCYDVFCARFVGAVLPTCPDPLRRALFQGFVHGSADATAGARLGLSLEDFTRGVAVLTLGTPEERLRFVYHAYCGGGGGGGGGLRKSTLVEHIRLFPDEGDALVAELQSPASEWGAVSEFAGPAEFAAWAIKAQHQHPDEPMSVVLWMFEFEDLLKRQGLRSHHRGLLNDAGGGCGGGGGGGGGSYDDSDGAGTGSESGDTKAATYAQGKKQSIATLSGLPEHRVAELLAAHSALAARSPTGAVCPATFERAVPSIPAALRARVFRMLDPRRIGSVGVNDLVTAAAILTPYDDRLEPPSDGPCITPPKGAVAAAPPAAAAAAKQDPTAVHTYCYKMFDASGRDIITRHDFEDLVCTVDSSVDALHRHVNRSAQPPHPRSPDAAAAAAKKAAAALPAGARSLPLEEFLGWVRGAASGGFGLQVRRFLRRVFQLVLMDLGVRPGSPAEEQSMVEELGVPFHPRERTGGAGATWCLVDRRWWDAWRRSVAGPCGDVGSPEPLRRQRTGEWSAAAPRGTPATSTPNNMVEASYSPASYVDSDSCYSDDSDEDADGGGLDTAARDPLLHTRDDADTTVDGRSLSATPHRRSMRTHFLHPHSPAGGSLGEQEEAAGARRWGDSTLPQLDNSRLLDERGRLKTDLDVCTRSIFQTFFFAFLFFFFLSRERKNDALPLLSFSTTLPHSGQATTETGSTKVRRGAGTT